MHHLRDCNRIAGGAQQEIPTVRHLDRWILCVIRPAAGHGAFAGARDRMLAGIGAGRTVEARG
jgi:hypothetical protein